MPVFSPHSVDVGTPTYLHALLRPLAFPKIEQISSPGVDDVGRGEIAQEERRRERADQRDSFRACEGLGPFGRDLGHLGRGEAFHDSGARQFAGLFGAAQKRLDDPAFAARRRVHPNRRVEHRECVGQLVVQEFVRIGVPETRPGAGSPKHAAVALGATGNGANLGEVQPRDPQAFHQHVQGLDPHDRRRGDPLTVDVDPAVGAELGQVGVEVNPLLGYHIESRIDRQRFDLKGDERFPLRWSPDLANPVLTNFRV